MYEIVCLEQNTPAWLGWRRYGVGASDVPAIKGESPYKTKLGLAREKLGLAEPPDLSNNPDVRRGSDNEEEARLSYDCLFGTFNMPVCAQVIGREWHRVSLDGWDVVSRTVLEIKCPRHEKALKAQQWAKANPGKAATKADLEGLGLYYYAQIQYQLSAMDATKAMLWVWDVDTKTGAAITVIADPDYQAEMLEVVYQFWTLISNGVLPDPDPERDVMLIDDPVFADAEVAYIQLYRQYAELKKQLKQIDEQMKQHQSTMSAFMGGYAHAQGPNGIKLTLFPRKGVIDYDAFIRAEAPEAADKVELYRKDTVEQIRVSGLS